MSNSLFQKYYLEIDLRGRVYGGASSDPEIFSKWTASKFPDNPEITEKFETDLDLTKEVELQTNQFRNDASNNGQGIYLHVYQMKAMIAQCASLLQITTKKKGSKQTLKEATFVKGIDADGTFTGEKLYLLPTRQKADGIETFHGNVPTPKGSRSILKNVQFCENAIVKAQMWILNARLSADNRGKGITMNDMSTILALAQEVGIGACRKFESGKFDVRHFVTWEDYLADNLVPFDIDEILEGKQAA